MRFEVRERASLQIIECVEPIARAEEALELISACMEHGSNRVLVESANFSPAFCDLRSGVAGEVVQKLVNYGVRLAGVFPSDEGYSDRFREFLREAKRGRAFRVFANRGDAEAWLAEGSETR